jgi:ABC-type proline/glycine betaine transport system ATPase subunit
VPFLYRKDTSTSELTSCQLNIVENLKAQLNASKGQILEALLGLPGVGKSRVITEIARLLEVREKKFIHL